MTAMTAMILGVLPSPASAAITLFQCLDQRAEMFAACLEILVTVVAGSAGAEQHDIAGAGNFGGTFYCFVQRLAAIDAFHSAPQKLRGSRIFGNGRAIFPERDQMTDFLDSKCHHL